MVKLLKTLPTLLLASFAAAQLTITRPSASVWWVAKSLNEIVWTCKTSTKETFTVLVNNKDPKILTSPLAVIAIQQNYQCSITITQDQANQPAGTGWTVIFANPLNNTEVYATSEEFEIKPLGSTYPPQGSPTDTNTSASATASSPSSINKSGALSLKAGLGAIGLAALGVAGLVI